MMKEGGRKSLAEKRAETAAIPGLREPAPEDLEPEAAALWTQIVNRLPADYFATENLPLLKAYCRHTVYADEAAQHIKAMRETIFELMRRNTKAGNRQLPRLRTYLHDLHKQHGAETTHMLQCATKLRLTNQSRYERGAVAAAKARAMSPSGRPPWHNWDRSEREIDAATHQN